MDPEVKGKWVAALRSGEYEQGYEYLKTVEPNGDTKYCCLGVLCQLQGYEWGPPIKGHPAVLPAEEGDAWQADQAVLPRNIRTKLGLTEDQQNDLIEKNDTHAEPFSVIANYIEENL